MSGTGPIFVVIRAHRVDGGERYPVTGDGERLTLLDFTGDRDGTAQRLNDLIHEIAASDPDGMPVAQYRLTITDQRTGAHIGVWAYTT